MNTQRDTSGADPGFLRSAKTKHGHPAERRRQCKKQSGLSCSVPSFLPEQLCQNSSYRVPARAKQIQIPVTWRPRRLAVF